jgi:phosphoribosylaminoimidazole-succinocarboxamide synthase
MLPNSSWYLALQVSTAALALFNFGQQQASQRGLLLVDTKYEFGKDEDGKIRLIDEVRFV